ncbi:MAG TPA: MOSC domain-containing protein, partial [Candidatus Deferrimicrobiaceae bacterium]
GRIVAVSVSERKGERKSPVPQATLVPDHGVERDAHAGPGHRQVSLLASESIGKMREKGLAVGPGDFAENVTVEGIDLVALKVGDRLRIGEALVEISQIGKECHDRCAIYFQAGDCVMPREGVFARVVHGGAVAPGDPVSKAGG